MHLLQLRMQMCPCYASVNRPYQKKMGTYAGTLMAHLQPDDGLLIDPWLSPAVFHSGSVHATLVEQPTLKITRLIRTPMNGLPTGQPHGAVAQ